MTAAKRALSIELSRVEQSLVTRRTGSAVGGDMIFP